MPPYMLQRARRSLARSKRARRGAPAVLVATLLAFLLLGAGGLAAAATLGAAAAVAVYHNFVADLPSVSAVDTRQAFKTTRILDREGNLLYELFDEDQGKRTVVRLADMPEVLTQAVLAVEDASFYDNPGIEPRGIVRAVWQNLRAGTVVSGGSTITQQLIRNVLLEPQERASETLTRKLKEAVLAVELSSSYSKDQILEWYLNEIYFGNLSYGVATAASTYFNKSPRDLTLAEAALLAGLPQAPARYDPFTNFDAAKRRQEEVLGLLVRNRFITRQEAERAREEPLVLDSAPATRSIRHPHWVFYVRSVLEEMYGAKGLLAAGLTVYTSLDPNLQEMAEEVVSAHRLALARQNANNASLVAIHPWDGEVLAMVGSPDYLDASIDGQVNNALTPQQPGSAIKPIVYLGAFLKGFSPATIVQDAPISLPDGGGGVWRPRNHDSRFRGPVHLRRALGNSLNIPAVKVLQYLGVEDAVGLARRLGMASLDDSSRYGLAFTLGGAEVRAVEIATAYTVLANGGLQVPVSPIRKILDGDGRVIFEHRPVREEAVDPRAAWLVNDILSDNTARTETFGSNSLLRLANNRPAAVKTGTSDDFRDTWTIGYTPSLVTAVWVGRTDNAPTRFVPGSSAAMLMWNTFTERALTGWPHEPFESPPGLVRESACASTGPDTECVRLSDWFLEERAPGAQRRLAARAIAVDRVSGKLADRDTPYSDVVFQKFQPPLSGDGPFAPTEYSQRTGVSRPWEVLPPAVLSTVLPSGPAAPGGASQPAPRAPVLLDTRIDSPAPGEQIRGPMEIVGAATSGSFRFYQLEYQLASGGGQWSTVREFTGQEPVANGTLDLWDTTTAPNGTYWIRLTVHSASGTASQTSTVVAVNNPGR